MNQIQTIRIKAMECSNEQCDTWYREGHHFFLICPNCNVPMVKVEREMEK